MSVQKKDTLDTVVRNYLGSDAGESEIAFYKTAVFRSIMYRDHELPVRHYLSTGKKDKYIFYLTKTQEEYMSIQDKITIDDKKSNLLKGDNYTFGEKEKEEIKEYITEVFDFIRRPIMLFAAPKSLKIPQGEYEKLAIEYVNQIDMYKAKSLKTKWEDDSSIWRGVDGRYWYPGGNLKDEFDTDYCLPVTFKRYFDLIREASKDKMFAGYEPWKRKLICNCLEDTSKYIFDPIDKLMSIYFLDKNNHDNEIESRKRGEEEWKKRLSDYHANDLIRSVMSRFYNPVSYTYKDIMNFDAREYNRPADTTGLNAFIDAFTRLFEDRLGALFDTCYAEAFHREWRNSFNDFDLPDKKIRIIKEIENREDPILDGRISAYFSDCLRVKGLLGSADNDMIHSFKERIEDIEKRVKDADNGIEDTDIYEELNKMIVSQYYDDYDKKKDYLEKKREEELQPFE